jgi:hypothetical protein
VSPGSGASGAAPDHQISLLIQGGTMDRTEMQMLSVSWLRCKWCCT